MQGGYCSAESARGLVCVPKEHHDCKAGTASQNPPVFDAASAVAGQFFLNMCTGS